MTNTGPGRRGIPAPKSKINPFLIAGSFLASVLSLGAYQMVSTKTPPPELPSPHDTTSSTPVITPDTPKPTPSRTAEPLAPPRASIKPTPTPGPTTTSRVYRLPPRHAAAEPVTPVTPKHAKPTPPPRPLPSPDPSVPLARLDVVIAFLKAQVGKPYVFGATGPNAYDCSGLIQTAYSRVGVTLPRTSEAQSAVGYGVSLDALRPGDILYFGPSGGAGHTAIYIGAGHYLAAENRTLGVVILPMTWDPPSGARRVLN